MNKIRPHSLGLVFGIFLALFHAVWALSILAGIAQWYMDFILKLHMIQSFIVVEPFSFMNAILLVVVTGIVGYIGGWIAGVIWNKYAVQ